MSVKYESEGVVFNDVIAGIHTGGQKITGYEYTYDENGNIVEPQPIVNSIDIDWNNAQVPGLENSIDSTAALLKIIGDINNRIKSMEEQSGQTDNQSHIMLTQEEYDALEEKDPNIVYFIVEDGDNPGGGGETSPIDIPLETQLLVNGVMHTEDNIVLTPGQIYTLQGVCLGTITVDTTQYDSEEMDEDIGNTEIRLNGLTVVNNSNFGIKYKTPDDNKGYKDLIVTLERNTINYIICQNVAPKEEDQPGALYSMNNLTVRGEGYLAVYNHAGHGIRATEIKLLGPNVYADTIHDAIHAKKLWICGGSYYINKANDAFGTGSGGSIKYAFGHINANNLDGELFDAPDGTLEYIEEFDIESDTEYQSNPTPANLTDSNTHIINENIGAVYQSNSNTNFKKGTPLGSTEVIANEAGVYVITQPYVFVTGFIDKPITIDTRFDVNPTIYLQNAYILTNKINDHNKPSIYFGPEYDALNINALGDTYNIIINNCGEIENNYDGDAIKSEHNIKMEIKNDGYLYISSTSGDGIDGSDVEITDSKGTLMIRNCTERGIKGNNVIVGPSGRQKGNVLEIITDPANNDYTTFEGAIIVNENCKEYGEKDIVISGGKIAPGSGYADIFARKGKALDKGTFISDANALRGILITNSIGATVTINMDNSANIYYKRLITSDTVVQTNISPVTNNNVSITNVKNNINSLISNN